MNILYVEDNSGDIGLLKSAFRNVKFAPNLQIAEDGAVAIEYLETIKQSHNKLDLILLDLNIPKVNGHDVLKRIKSDTELQKIQVIVFTSSQNENERLKCLELGAEYSVKPLDYVELIEFAKSIKSLAVTPSADV